MEFRQLRHRVKREGQDNSLDLTKVDGGGNGGEINMPTLTGYTPVQGEIIMPTILAPTTPTAAPQPTTLSISAGYTPVIMPTILAPTTTQLTTPAAPQSSTLEKLKQGYAEKEKSQQTQQPFSPEMIAALKAQAEEATKNGSIFDDFD